MCAAFAMPVVHVIFENGNFDAFSTEMTSQVFAMYALGMAGFCVLDFINKAYYTMHRVLPPLLINAVVLVLNVVLNKTAGRSIGTIGMTTAIALTVGGVLALCCFFRDTAGAFRWKRLACNAGTAVAVGILLSILHRRLYDPAMGKLVILGMYLFLGVLGALVYLAVSWFLGERETIRQLLRRGKRGDDQ